MSEISGAELNLLFFESEPIQHALNLYDLLDRELHNRAARTSHNPTEKAIITALGHPTLDRITVSRSVHDNISIHLDHHPMHGFAGVRNGSMYLNPSKRHPLMMHGAEPAQFVYADDRESAEPVMYDSYKMSESAQYIALFGVLEATRLLLQSQNCNVRIIGANIKRTDLEVDL